MTEQSRCLMATQGWEFIDRMDDLPPVVRRRLAESPFNLCVACVVNRAHEIGGINYRRDDRALLLAIEDMEWMIREGRF